MGKMMDKVRALAPEGCVRIEVSYYGSGDSFEEFSDTAPLDKDGKDMRYEDPALNMKEKIDEDDLWTILEQSDANFNNEGSRGEIVFDFEADEIRVENRYIVESEEPGGGCTFKDED
jgi:hypothetical protein